MEMVIFTQLFSLASDPRFTNLELGGGRILRSLVFGKTKKGRGDLGFGKLVFRLPEQTDMGYRCEDSLGLFRVEQKNLAKSSDTCSVRADVLCIGSPRLVGGRKAGKIKHARIFCSTL